MEIRSLGWSLNEPPQGIWGRGSPPGLPSPPTTSPKPSGPPSLPWALVNQVILASSGWCLLGGAAPSICHLLPIPANSWLWRQAPEALGLYLPGPLGLAPLGLLRRGFHSQERGHPGLWVLTLESLFWSYFSACPTRLLPYHHPRACPWKPAECTQFPVPN